MKWTVSTMGHSKVVEAESAFSACVNAVRDFSELGHLMSATPEGSKFDSDDTCYCSTIRVCDAAGIIVEPQQ